MKRIRYRGRLYVLAGDTTVEPRSLRDSGAAQKAALKALKALILRHYKKQKDLEPTIHDQPKDDISYRSWREHIRCVRLFKNLQGAVEKDPSIAQKVLDILKDSKDQFIEYWNGVEKSKLDVQSVPDDFDIPAVQPDSDTRPLSVVPSQYITRRDIR